MPLSGYILPLAALLQETSGPRSGLDVETKVFPVPADNTTLDAQVNTKRNYFVVNVKIKMPLYTKLRRRIITVLNIPLGV
jgi:hypothetical protein